MIDHTAEGIQAARARARVSTLEVHARAVALALRVNGALGSTVGRHSHVFLLASAGWRASHVSTNGKTSAWRRYTWVLNNGWLDWR